MIMFHFRMESCFEVPTPVLLKKIQSVPFTLWLYVSSISITGFYPVFTFLYSHLQMGSSSAFVFGAFVGFCLFEVLFFCLSFIVL